MKKFIALILALCLACCLVACGEKTPEPEITEPTAPPVPTNLFTNNSDRLNHFYMDGVEYEISANLPSEFQKNGYTIGTKDTAVSILLGYPKGDADYLCYKYNDMAVNCAYCCVVDPHCKLVFSFKTVNGSKLGLNTPQLSSNENFVYAGCITINTTAKEMLSIMGEPTDMVQKDDGEITNMTFITRDESGAAVDKYEMEFVAERLYKLTIIKTVA